MNDPELRRALTYRILQLLICAAALLLAFS